jgi:hypothetical protein
MKGITEGKDWSVGERYEINLFLLNFNVILYQYLMKRNCHYLLHL